MLTVTVTKDLMRLQQGQNNDFTEELVETKTLRCAPTWIIRLKFDWARNSNIKEYSHFNHYAFIVSEDESAQQ